MSPTDDGQFLPWQKVEKPTARTLLQERLEGQQISRLYYLDDPGPTASRGLAIELTNGARLIIFAGRDRNSQYSARLAFRWLPTPLIVLPRMARAFSGGRDGDLTSERPDELQRYVEGAVIRGVIHRHTPHISNRGEWLEIEFSGGDRLGLCASVIEQPRKKLLADIAWWYTGAKVARIVMP